MRYLHVVGQHETFVASGVYIYYGEDGQPDGRTESWAIHELPDGAQLLRVDRDTRATGQGWLLLEAWRSPIGEGGRIERFDVHAYGPADAPVRTVKATYSLYNDYVEIGRTIDETPRQYTEVPLPGGCIAYPRTALFTGPLIAQVAGQETSVFTYTPGFDDAESAFAGRVSTETATFEKEGTMALAGGDVPTRAYRWPAGSERIVWLDDHDTMLAQDKGTQRRVMLTRYARRPDKRP